MPRKLRTIADLTDLAFKALADALFPVPPRAPRAPKVKQPKVAKVKTQRQGPTLYEILGVDRKASAAVIEAAWKAQARELHPDRNKSADAAKRMAMVNHAHDVLSDPAKRKEYDRR